jgi:hypothetical protein
MFNIYKKNKVPRLNQKKALINNDLTLSEYDPLSVFTIVSIPTLLLISMKIFMMKGSI